jgi:hypothetical protein
MENNPISINNDPTIRINNLENDNNILDRKLLSVESRLKSIELKTESVKNDKSSIRDVLDYIDRERIENRLYTLMCTEI